MVRAVAASATTAADRAAIARLLSSASIADNPPLSDHLLVELRHPESATTTITVLAEASDGLTGMGVVAPGNGSWSLETVTGESAAGDRVDPDHGTVADQLFGEALEAVAARGGGDVTWWRLQSTDGDSIRAAETHGFALHRELHQMRRALPIRDTTDVAVRAFRRGHDDAAWLGVNNRAFADHAEQGGWDEATLGKRMDEPWFDPAGFLLHDRDGVLAAFCWTKVHTTTEPPMGEIYAIAVDPAFHGLGLGKALTVAGLVHLGAQRVDGRRLDTAMLHVDGGNSAAVGLYRTLGFEIHHTDRAYIAHVAARIPTDSSSADRPAADPTIEEQR